MKLEENMRRDERKPWLDPIDQHRSHVSVQVCREISPAGQHMRIQVEHLRKLLKRLGCFAMVFMMEVDSLLPLRSSHKKANGEGNEDLKGA